VPTFRTRDERFLNKSANNVARELGINVFRVGNTVRNSVTVSVYTECVSPPTPPTKIVPARIERRVAL